MLGVEQAGDVPVVLGGEGRACAGRRRRAPRPSAGQLVARGLVRVLARVNGTSGIAIRRHYVVHLLEFVGEPLLRREFVFLQGHGQLLIVLARIAVQFVESAVRVELVCVQLKLSI